MCQNLALPVLCVPTSLDTLDVRHHLHRKLHRVHLHGTYKTVKARLKTVKATYKTVKATYKTVKATYKTVKAYKRHI